MEDQKWTCSACGELTDDISSLGPPGVIICVECADSRQPTPFVAHHMMQPESPPPPEPTPMRFSTVELREYAPEPEVTPPDDPPLRYCGGWRKEYATAAKRFGFRAQCGGGNSIDIFSSKGTYLVSITAAPNMRLGETINKAIEAKREREAHRARKREEMRLKASANTNPANNNFRSPLSMLPIMCLGLGAISDHRMLNTDTRRKR